MFDNIKEVNSVEEYLKSQKNEVAGNLLEKKEVKTITPEVMKPNLDTWAEKSEELLRKHNSPYRIVKGNSFLFFKVVSILLLIAIIVVSGTFLYFMQDGKFQSLVNNTMSCPSINIPNCPTISCPNCSCPSCPSLNCNSSTPLIKLDLANLNCTTK